MDTHSPLCKMTRIHPCLMYSYELPHAHLQTQDSPVASSLGSYVSVTESQLSVEEAVYPELVDCSQTVDKVLPQLTTSMW